MGKADGIFLKKKKYLSYRILRNFITFRRFHIAALFLDLENDTSSYLELADEIISTLKELPVAARIVLGLDADTL